MYPFFQSTSLSELCILDIGIRYNSNNNVTFVALSIYVTNKNLKALHITIKL